MSKRSKNKVLVQRPAITFLSEDPVYAQDDITLPMIGALFLVMPYDAKYLKLEKAIRNFFNGIYNVNMAKDYMQDILGCICDKIKDVDFGIVVLAGLKYKKKKKNRVRMNIPFEYGMFKILEKPAMLIREKRLNIDINEEFSDVRNENYGERIDIRKPIKQIEKRIGQIFKKFIPELAKKSAERTLEELSIKADFLYSERNRLRSHFITQYEIQIKNQFKDKIN